MILMKTFLKIQSSCKLSKENIESWFDKRSKNARDRELERKMCKYDRYLEKAKREIKLDNIPTYYLNNDPKVTIYVNLLLKQYHHFPESVPEEQRKFYNLRADASESYTARRLSVYIIVICLAVLILPACGLSLILCVFLFLVICIVTYPVISFITWHYDLKIAAECRVMCVLLEKRYSFLKEYKSREKAFFSR